MPVEVRLEWFGEQRKAEIRYKLNNGMVKATKYLHRKIKSKINEWGSEFITSIKRKRVRHSAPGQPPLKQTGNLEKSIDYNFSWGEDGYIVGTVFSDAPYAETLERGGSVQIDQSLKTHTRVRIVNPLKHVIAIAARPFFGPTFRDETEKLIGIIQKG